MYIYSFIVTAASMKESISQQVFMKDEFFFIVVVVEGGVICIC